MKFVDQAHIHVKAGQGGNGCKSFRREKYVPKGGPDGGDGGRGGHVFLVGDKGLRTLQDFRYKRDYSAARGQHGMGANKHGKDGQDILIRVPCGTLVYDADRNQLADITLPQQQVCIAQGGKGGRGNARFATSTNRAPTHAQEGLPGEEKDLVFELKLIADVGLVGKPNAGKSTLLSHLSDARPKIADYPFTTLNPMLGIVRVDDFQSFVLADIPGLIEGAHQGKGLGHHFLRHIERTRVLVFLVDLTDPDPEASLKELQSELHAHDPALLQKKSMVVYNKLDLVPKPSPKNSHAIFISAVAGTGLVTLKRKIFSLLAEENA